MLALNVPLQPSPDRLTAADVIAACEQRLPAFQRATEGVGFEPKGIFHSEMLLVCSISELLGVRLVVESGVARAQSTLVLARYFADRKVRVHSVERRRYSADAPVAKRRLTGFEHADVHYGDAFELVPALVTEPAVVLIDGPKGHYALLLATTLLRDPRVGAVFIHDVHKDSDTRALMERLYPEAFFTDDQAFVERFSGLDGPCWDGQARDPRLKDWGPYRRGDVTMQSYSATLGMILRNEATPERVAEFVEIINEEQARKLRRTSTLRSFAAGLKSKLLEAAALPYWFLRTRLGGRP